MHYREFFQANQKLMPGVKWDELSLETAIIISTNWNMKAMKDPDGYEEVILYDRLFGFQTMPNPFKKGISPVEIVNTLDIAQIFKDKTTPQETPQTPVTPDVAGDSDGGMKGGAGVKNEMHTQTTEEPEETTSQDQDETNDSKDREEDTED